MLLVIQKLSVISIIRRKNNHFPGLFLDRFASQQLIVNPQDRFCFKQLKSYATVVGREQQRFLLHSWCTTSVLQTRTALIFLVHELATDKGVCDSICASIAPQVTLPFTTDIEGTGLNCGLAST